MEVFIYKEVEHLQKSELIMSAAMKYVDTISRAIFSEIIVGTLNIHLNMLY